MTPSDEWAPRTTPAKPKNPVSGFSPRWFRSAVSPQPCHVTADGIRPRKSPRFPVGRRYQRQVSWLAISRLNPTFPADASGRIELKQTAYSCGSSHGLGFDDKPHRVPFSPPRGNRDRWTIHMGCSNGQAFSRMERHHQTS